MSAKVRGTVLGGRKNPETGELEIYEMSPEQAQRAIDRIIANLPKPLSAPFADKWVRIMCDFCADGVWARGGGAADLENLPVSADLRQRIRGWQDWFQRHAGMDDFRDAPPEFGIDAFSAKGLSIAKAVKAELPDWTVIYHDEARCFDACNSDEASMPRSYYEYGIEPGG